MTSQLEAGPSIADPESDRTSTGGSARQRVAALVVLIALALVGVAATLSLRTPAPLPVSAAPDAFSADRATALLPGIASVPHPSGSAAAAEVRAYLTTQLRGLGLEPDVRTAVAARSPEGGHQSAGTVSNVHARIAGSDPTGRVLLVAHYDSVPTGPGASDNGANVAAILEVARALRTGPAPRNDVDLLFTDGEEAGLLGAQAFVDSGAAGDPARVVVVNLEARGVSGPAVMFQMAGTGLTPAVRAADPVTTSFAAAVYQVLPNDTDLTVFDEAGMRGLNFAYIEGSAHYHAPHDDIAHVSGGSVQDMGSSVLAATRDLAAADLSATGGDSTYFSLFGAVVSYPGWLVLPLAALTLVAYVLLLVTGRRQGLRLGGVGRAAGTFAIMVPGALLIGVGVWLLLTRLRPEFTVGLGGIYQPAPYALAEVALLLAVLVAWYRLARRKATPSEVAAGVLGWLTLFAVVFAVLLPGGAYLFTWPALIGVVALAAALRFTDAGSPVRTLAGCAAAVPGMALLLPVVLLLVPALGIGLSAVPLLFAALLAGVLLAVLEPLPSRRLLTAATLALAVGAAATVGVSVVADGYSPAKPRPVSLGYVLETDSGTATWVSVGGQDQPGVGPLLTAGQISLADRVPPIGQEPVNSGPAPLATLAPPEVSPVAPPTDESDGVRSVRVKIQVPAGAYAVDVYTDTTILSATVAGAPLAAATDTQWGFRYSAPPAEGFELTVRTRGPGPLRLRVVSSTAGLPSDVGAPTLPADAAWSSWPVIPAQTFVVRTVEL
ncbi:aminopeptidase [Asanoa ishikariensis]|uniref:Vacuolar membrane protease n=1 Tax=Asanoa ishikariensis TaxID=137265 RepID=A0A1H3TBH2_9ACTN|nr:M20/M25/M40 family metallo-hydrolase [Asanoa ishikariensis]GIF62780.1 aminopeptidase [Asanoa ishikariensis]SDZ47191.1 Zn-dependent amino-or carboxypeptidase, M28 family [Asanoa ishikariensis]